MVSGIGAEALSSGVIPNKRTSRFLTLLILESLESMAKLVEGVVLTYLAATAHHHYTCRSVPNEGCEVEAGMVEAGMRGKYNCTSDLVARGSDEGSTSTYVSFGPKNVQVNQQFMSRRCSFSILHAPFSARFHRVGLTAVVRGGQPARSRSNLGPYPTLWRWLHMYGNANRRASPGASTTEHLAPGDDERRLSWLPGCQSAMGVPVAGISFLHHQTVWPTTARTSARSSC